MVEENQRLICLDTSVLIEYFRRTKKENSFFNNLTGKDYHGFIVPVIVQFEIYIGSGSKQIEFWNNLFQDFIIIPYTESINMESVRINKALKSKRVTISSFDLFIAATAKTIGIGLATLNKKHFDKIDGLQIVTPDNL